MYMDRKKKDGMCCYNLYFIQILTLSPSRQTEDSKHAAIVICVYFYLFLYISCIIQFHFMSFSKGKEINLSDIIYWCSKHSSLFYELYMGDNQEGCKFHILNVSFH